MALIGFWGFDDTTTENGVTLSMGTTAGRTGGLAARLGTAAGGPGATVLLATPVSSFVHGFAFWLGLTASAICYYRDTAGGQTSTTNHIALTTNTNNNMVLSRNGTVLATSTQSFNFFPGWNYIEVKAVINDTTGSVEVKVNGNVWITFSGDTRNAANGAVDTFYHPGHTGPGNIWDDMYLVDMTGAAPYNDYLGDIVVKALLPDGNGDSSQWTGSDADSVNNYQLVDESNSSSADYVAASSAGLTDLYTMADLPSTYNVLAIQNLVYAAKSDGGIENTLKAIAKGQAGTIREDPALPALSTSYIAQPSQIQTTDPDGNPLTPTTVNAMQIGVRTS
jgi:hypothetical protein